jgi:RHS repeat-associated protein
VAAPLSAIIDYAYDAHDNRTGITDPRVTAKTFPNDSAENVSYTYDQSGAGDSIGRLTHATDESGGTRYVYDELGDVTQQRTLIFNFGAQFVMNYIYDLASHVSQITYPLGRIVTYTRDAMGRIASVATQQNNAASPITVASGASYEPFGPLAALSFGNGLNLAAGFDQDYQPSTRSVTSATATVQNLSYGFDAAGDLLTITDALASARTQNLQYDALYRLTQAAGVYGTFTYGYDATGNRTSLGLTNSSGTSSSTYNYASTSNELQSVVTGANTRNFLYFATGNVNVDFAFPELKLTDNQDNRLVQVASAAAPGPITYTQNFLGQRVIKAPTGTGALDSHYDLAGHLLDEHIGTATQRDYVWLDDLPLAFITNGTTLDYIHTDHLGTPQKMTDGGQNVVWDGGASDPFMLVPLPTNVAMNLRLPGQYFDSETGLHQNGMRDYDPTLGRYIESDPIGLAGGINTYAYAGNNPVRFVDPSGTSQSSSIQCAAAATLSCIDAAFACYTQFGLFHRPCTQAYNRCVTSGTQTIFPGGIIGHNPG